MKNIGVNTVVGVIFIAFSLFWNVIINNLPSAKKFVAYGPQFFPRIVVSGIIIISILLIIQDILNKNEKITFAYKKADAIRVIFLVLVVAIYIFVMPIIGYLLSTMVTLAVVLCIFGLRNIKNLILIPVIYTLLSNYIFRALLRVGLP
jgi:putative tricarboxylic transport membrane protein